MNLEWPSLLLLLAIVRPPSSDAFSSLPLDWRIHVKSLQPHVRWTSPSSYPGLAWCLSASSQREFSDQEETIDGNEASQMSKQKKRPFSKVKWKRKQYLMVQDVKKMVRQGDPNAPRKAQEMVKRMRTEYEGNGRDFDLKPSLQAYNLWIHALARSGWEKAGDLAEEVLEEMRATGVNPDVVTYTSVMDAHAKSRNPKRAEELLLQLLDQMADSDAFGFSSITCDTVLNAYAQQGTRESAERAETILFRLEQLQQRDIRPTAFSYCTVINAWAKVGSADGAEKAEALLHHMNRKSQTGQSSDELIRPDTVVYNAVINAWASSGDPRAGDKALGLLREMKDLAKTEGLDTLPDSVTYNTILSAWSHSGDPNAARRTEKIVQEMRNDMQESRDNAPAPNTVSYNNVLHAWSKSTLPGAATRAHKVLDYMVKSGNKSISPDIVSYTSVLNAYAKSKEPNKARMTQKLLDQLLAQYEATQNRNLRPTNIPFNAVLNACAFSAIGTSLDEQREALQIAVQTFSSMRKSNVLPDTVTYGNLLKCFANLMPQGQMRYDMALQIFEKCCEDGQVGVLVWNEVRRAVPNSLLAKQFNLKASPSNLELHDLPRKWRRSNNSDKRGQKTKDKVTSDAEARPQIKATITEPSFESGKDL